MRAAILLLALVALAPTAAAIPWEISLTDYKEDVVDANGNRTAVATADIVGFSSTQANGTITQRLEMLVAPDPKRDHVMIRNTYANGTNGAWHALEVEVRIDVHNEPYARATLREGAYANATDVPVAWRVEENAWVFWFDAARVPEAQCFDPGVFVTSPARGASPEETGLDSLYPAKRRCTGMQRSPPPMPSPIIDVRTPTPSVVGAPGTDAPTPGVGVAALVVSVGALALARRRSPP